MTGENEVIALLIVAETVTRLTLAAFKHAATQRQAERKASQARVKEITS